MYTTNKTAVVSNVGRDQPLHALVKREMLRFIEVGTYPPGSRLASEPELAHQLGVSRVVLREATQTLVEDGVLVRKPGIGTFVNLPYPVIDSELTNDLGLTETIQRAGLVAGTSSVDVRSVQATADQARRLGRQEGAALWCVERVRTANDRAVAFTADYVPADLCGPDFASVVADGSIYRYLGDRGIHIKDSDACLVPAKVGPDIGRRLGINAESVVLLIEQNDYSHDGEVVLLSEEYHVRTAFRFLVRRERNEASLSKQRQPTGSNEA